MRRCIYPRPKVSQRKVWFTCTDGCARSSTSRTDLFPFRTLHSVCHSRLSSRPCHDRFRNTFESPVNSRTSRENRSSLTYRHAYRMISHREPFSNVTRKSMLNPWRPYSFQRCPPRRRKVSRKRGLSPAMPRLTTKRNASTSRSIVRSNRTSHSFLNSNTRSTLH